jgi:hypothetical protein
MPLTVTQAVEKGRDEIARLTGQPIVSVVSCLKEGEQWRVTLETLERKAVPDTSDLLAGYLVHLEDGRVANFQRLGVRRRGAPMKEGETW